MTGYCSCQTPWPALKPFAIIWDCDRCGLPIWGTPKITRHNLEEAQPPPAPSWLRSGRHG